MDTCFSGIFSCVFHLSIRTLSDEISIPLGFTFKKMEAVGVAFGVAGLVSVCRDAIEQIDTYKNFGLESHAIKARFELSKQIFRLWANDVGITDINMSKSHHPCLDDPDIASVVKETLVSIGEIFQATANSSFARRLGLSDNNLLPSARNPGGLPQKSSTVQKSSKRDKLAWTLGGKASFAERVDAFGDLVEKLCTLVGMLFESFRC